MRQKPRLSLKISRNESSLVQSIENSGMGFWQWKVGSDVIEWSDQVYRLFEVKPKEFDCRYESYLKLIHPQDRNKISKTIENAFTKGKNYTIQHRLKLKNGKIKWIEGVGNIIKNTKGKVTKIAGIVRDITSEKKIESDRANWKNRFDLIAKSAGVVLYDYQIKSGKIQWSGESIETLGYTHKEMGNVDAWEKRIHPEDREQAIGLLDKAMENISRYDVSYRFKNKAGKYIHLHDRGFFLAGEDGKAQTMLGMMNDISDRLEAEGKFQKLISELTIGVLVYDANGKVIVTNNKAQEILNYHPFGLVGLALENKLMKEDGTRYQEKDLILQFSTRSKSKKKDIIVGIEHEQQKVKWIILQSQPLTDKQGKVNQLVVTLTDITENKKYQTDLIESEKRFRSLQEASFGGIGMHDKGIIIDCNQGLCEITGYSYDELIGMNGLNLIAEEYRSFVLERIVSGYEKPYDTEGIKKDGTRYFLEIRGKNTPYKGKEIRVTEFRDITDRKKSEQKISEQNARLIAIAEDLKLKNDQLEEFTQIVSHNLRSPVGNIITLLEFIENSVTEAEKSEYLNLLKVSAEKIQSTLTELHEVLRIKQNTNIEKTNLSFFETLAATKLLLHTQIVQSNTIIEADFSACETIFYPKVYLDSIMLNLISNAIKYSKKNVPPIIRIKTEKKNGVCIMTCSDNGLGIDLEKNSQKLFKLHKTFHEHPESRGIGLFMIKNQIEAMGGSIKAESKVNNGTTFIVKFNEYNPT